MFECAFFRSVCLLVIDFDTELCFDIYLNRFGGIRSVIAKFRKDFSRNKVFVKILMSQMVYAMASMRLDRLFAAPNSGAFGNWNCKKIPRAFIRLAFQSVAVGIDSD